MIDHPMLDDGDEEPVSKQEPRESGDDPGRAHTPARKQEGGDGPILEDSDEEDQNGEDGLADAGVGLQPAGGGPIRKRRSGRGSAVPPRPKPDETTVESNGDPPATAHPSGGKGDTLRVTEEAPPEGAPAEPLAEPDKGTSSAQKTVPPQPKLYVAARWAELNDPAAPWWTRSQGIGLRLRLRELLEIAMARSQHATKDRPVTDMRTEARTMLLRKQNYLQERHGETAKALEDALDVEKFQSLPPRGLTYSVIEATMKQLEDTDLIAALIDELCRNAKDATTADKLLALDENVELIDAELAYEGHSVVWRRDLAADIGKRIENRDDLEAAITVAIGAARADWPKELRFIIPVTEVQPRHERAFDRIADPRIVREVLNQWQEAIPDDDDGFELTELGAYDLSIGAAVDENAAIERAQEWVEQLLALYRLQGGQLVVADRWLMLDESDGSASFVNRPRPMNLLPPGIKAMEAVLTGDPSAKKPPSDLRLADAFMQLAQARSTAAGAALTDLWTVVEAVFTGAASEPSHSAGDVMAELLEYLYPLALLDWMGRRLQALGIEKKDNRSLADWALWRFDKRAKETFSKLEGDADPLMYVRARMFGKWSGNPREEEPSQHMLVDLKAVCTRCERVAARAYLVRNFYVHRAQPDRATALKATLPVFAELVRVALGYIAADADRANVPITSAKLAMMRIRQCAFDFGEARRFGGQPLRDALRADL